MTSARASRLLGFGHCAPARRIENAEIEARLGLEAGWIERRTGIRARRWADALSDLAARAGEAALADAGLNRPDIGLTLLATSTPDHLLPPTAPLVAHRLGLARSGAIDLAGACSGFIYALTLADGFVKAQGLSVLVIAANILSRRINHAEHASAILFADAAGAVVLGPTDDPARGILGADLASEGEGYDLISIPAGGGRRPFSSCMGTEETLMTIRDGREVFTRAVRLMTDCSRRAMKAAGVASADIDRFVPHQANARMFEAVARRLDLPEDRVVRTIEEYGNSSAATIALSLSIARERRPFAAGERVLLAAAGAGLTAGAIVVGF